MSILTATPIVTPEEFLKMPDSVAFELVDGHLVERHMGAESSEIAVRIIILLGIFLRTARLGRIFGSDTSYQCFADAPDKVRRADVGCVRFDRLLGGRAPKEHCRIAPDFVVEVVSPNDTAEEVDEKVFEWLRAGVPLVWVVSPGVQTVRIHRPRTAAGGPVSILSDDDVLTGEDVLPGFSCPVREVFDNA